MFRQYYGIPDDAKYGETFMSRFPILFQNRNKSMRETCMCWGIECPIGWLHILEQLCTFLEFTSMEFKRQYGIAVIADQVKEKYGTLRFYYHVSHVDADGIVACLDECSEPDEKAGNETRIASDMLELVADNAISEAEAMTEKTCANCGVPIDDNSTVETRGWISYVCKDCFAKMNGEQAEDAGSSSSSNESKADI